MMRRRHNKFEIRRLNKEQNCLYFLAHFYFFEVGFNSFFMYRRLKEKRRLYCFIRSKPQFKSASTKYVKSVCSFSNVCMILFIVE